MQKGNVFSRLGAGIKKAFNNPSFTIKEQLGFSAGSFGFSMAHDMIGTFLVIFLTDFMGIAAGMITLLMVVAQVINAVADPVAGALVDRTNTPYGKARPYLLLSPLPLCITSIILFIDFGLTPVWRIVTVFIFYIIFGISEAFFDMSRMAVSARMTTNAKDRKNFYTIAQFAGYLGTMLPGGVIPIFISLYAGHEKTIYLLGAVFFGLIGMAVMFVPYVTLKEKNLVFDKPVPVKINAKAILTNRPLLVSMASRLMECFRQITFGALVYFYKQTLGAYWLSTLIGTISVILSYSCLALFPIFARKLSPRTIMIIGYWFTGILYLLLFLCGYSNVWVVGAFIAISGATAGMLGAARTVLVADSTDYMEYKTWKKWGTPVRSDGMVFAMNALATRITSAIKDSLLPVGLAVIGYISARTMGGMTINVVQPESTLNGLFYLVSIPGAIGNLLAGGLLFFDDFHGKKRDRIMTELEELHKQEAAEAIAEGVDPSIVAEAICVEDAPQEV